MKRIHLAIEGIIAATLATVACSESSEPSRVTPTDTRVDASTGTSDFDPFPDQSELACNPPIPDLASDLKPATAVDYVEIRRQVVGFGDGGVSSESISMESDEGTPCATATNENVCLDALAVARRNTTTGWKPEYGGGLVEPYARYLVYTRGDEVGTVLTAQDLARFVAPVDTLGEALLLGDANQRRELRCEKPTEYDVPVPTPGWRKNADGSFEVVTVSSDCGSDLTRERYRVDATGEVTLVARAYALVDGGGVCGRRPDGLVDLACARADVGAYFAEVTWLEAAAVVAFRRVESDLVALGAPTELIVAAQRAQADEIRHAREASALARRFGGVERPLEVAPPVERDAFAIALENAVEGCVRETYGALAAAYQAKRAEDPAIRAFFARIAPDEANHAALSHDIAAWLEPQLTTEERAHIATAKDAALAELRATTEASPYAKLAGLPGAEHVRLLVDGMQREILAA